MVLYMNEHLHLFKDYLLFLAGEWITHGHIPGELIQPMAFLKKCEKAPRPRPPLQNKCLHVYITSKHIKAVEDLLLSSWQEINQKKRKKTNQVVSACSINLLQSYATKTWFSATVHVQTQIALPVWRDGESFLFSTNANSQQSAVIRVAGLPLGDFLDHFCLNGSWISPQPNIRAHFKNRSSQPKHSYQAGYLHLHQKLTFSHLQIG